MNKSKKTDPLANGDSLKSQASTDMLKKTSTYSRKTAILTVLYLVISLAVFLFFVPQINLENETTPGVVFSDLELDAYGYEIVDGNWVNVIGDAQIVMPEVSQDINTVTLTFSQPLENEILIQVYTANEIHGFSPDHVEFLIIPAGHLSAMLYINEFADDLRIDIGHLEGETFVLDHISINDMEGMKNFNDLTNFYLVIKLIACLLILWSTFFLFVIKSKRTVTYLVIVLVLGIIYMTIITPFSVPDEKHHYLSSYKISNLMMLKWDSLDYGSSADLELSNFKGHYNTADGYTYVRDNLFNVRPQNELVEIPPPNDISYPLQYIPQAIGISIARILNLNMLWLFYLGRFCNLLFYVVCVGIAIKRVPKFKTTIFLIAILPMAIQQGASLSYDVFINGLSFILMAYMFAAIYEKGAFAKKDFWVILICSALLMPAKATYLVLSFLVFLIPKARFKNSKQRAVMLASIIISGLVVVALFKMASIQMVTTDAPKLNWEGAANYSITYVIQHPLEILKMIDRTLNDRGELYYLGMIGGRLSGLSLNISDNIVYLFTALLVLSVLYTPKKEKGLLSNGDSFQMPISHRLVYVLMVVTTLIVTMLYLLVTWTSSYQTMISGVQGRYFIPVLFVAALPFYNRIISFKFSLDNWWVTGALLLQFFTILEIMAYTV